MTAWVTNQLLVEFSYVACECLARPSLVNLRFTAVCKLSITMVALLWITLAIAHAACRLSFLDTGNPTRPLFYTLWEPPESTEHVDLRDNTWCVACL